MTSAPESALVEPKRTYTIPLKKYQLETIAKLLCLNANTVDSVADITGIDVSRISNLLGGRNKTFNVEYERCRKIVMQNHSGAMMDMIELMPKGRDAIERALDSNDTRLAADNAWKLYDAVGVTSSSRQQAAESGNVTNITFNNQQAATILTESVAGVGNMLNDLRAHLATEVERSHELIGAEALPVPPGQLEVGDGEALPTVEDADGVFHLLPMREGE